MTTSGISKAKEQARHGKGNSFGAMSRRAKANRGTVFSGRPGDTLELSDRKYKISPSGAFIRQSK